MRRPLSAITQIYRKLQKDQISSMSAAVAFYAALALGPLSMGLLLASSFVEPKIVLDSFVWIENLLGAEARATFEAVWQGAHEFGARSFAGLFVLFGGLLFAAPLFSQLQSSLNIIFGVKRQSFKQWLKKKLLSYFLVLGSISLLLVISFLSSITEFEGRSLGLVTWTTSFLSFALAIGLLYRWLPDLKILWRQALVGALIMSVFFELSKQAFALYLQHSMTLSVYGAAATFPVFLLWVYFSSYLFFLGAEVTAFLHKSRKNLLG
ncbi:MAG: YihY/virulence factor BrkB family protein [Bradymonadales bacterium]|nr:MAG: YihY/virulence factor BrkB family protein [Bradymonadales bacterium]